jgi:hypothetical protein
MAGMPLANGAAGSGNQPFVLMAGMPLANGAAGSGNQPFVLMAGMPLTNGAERGEVRKSPLIRRPAFLLSLFLVLLLAPLCAYRENPFTLMVNGARTTALGGAFATGIVSADSLYNNPAALPVFTRPMIAYQFDTEIRFRGLRFDYRLRFDYISCFGAMIQGAGGNWGIAWYSLFRGSGISKDIFTYPFIVRKIGVSHGFALRENLLLGFNVGPAIATEGVRWALFPSLQAGVLWKPIENLSLGAYLLTPNWFDYRVFSGADIQESTPLTAHIGVGWEPIDNFRILGEISYQGWDAVRYVKAGVSDGPATGTGGFDPGQDLFFSLGILFQSDGGRRRKLVQERGLREKISRLREEIEELVRDPAADAVRSEMNALKRSDDAGRDRAWELENRTLSNAEKLIVRDERRLLSQKQGELRQALVAATNVRILVGAAAETAKRRARADEISNEIVSLEQRILQRNRRVRTPEEEAEYAKIQEGLSNFRPQMMELRKKEIAATEEREKRLADAREKAQSGEYLAPSEDLLLAREQAAQVKRGEASRLQALLSKPRPASAPKGEYYLSFNHEVVYQPDGTYLKMGSLSGGFSFRPAGIERLYFNVSVTDKSLLGLLGVFPDNDLVETIKLSAEFQF